MLDVIPVQIGNEFLEPLFHNLVVLVAVTELGEEDGPTLTRLFVEGRDDRIREVIHNGLAAERW